MKRTEIRNNLIEIYKFIQPIIPRESEESFNSEDIEIMVDNVLSDANRLSYEKADKIYTSNLSDYIKKDIEFHTALWEKILFCGTVLFVSYGLGEDEYKEWSASQNIPFSELLNAIAGEKLSDKTIDEFKKYYDSKAQSHFVKNIDLRPRNGITITNEITMTEEEINSSVIVALSEETNIVFSKDFDIYNEAYEEYFNVFNEIIEGFIKDFDSRVKDIKSHSEKFPKALEILLELYNDCLSEIPNKSIRLLRKYNCDVHAIQEFQNNQNKRIEELKEYLYNKLSPLVNKYDEAYPEDQSYNHAYLNSYNTIASIGRSASLIQSGRANAVTFVANEMVTDVISGITNSIADSVTNSINKSRFDSQFKKVILDDSFKGFLLAITSILFEKTKILFFNSTKIRNLNLRDSVIDNNELNAVIDNHFGIRNIGLNDEAERDFLLTKILDAPYDSNIYALLFLFYGNINQISSVAEYLNLTEELTDNIVNQYKRIVGKIGEMSCITRDEFLLYAKRLNELISNLDSIGVKLEDKMIKSFYDKAYQEYFSNITENNIVEVGHTMSDVNTLLKGRTDIKEFSCYYQQLEDSKRLFLLLNKDVKGKIEALKNEFYPYLINGQDSKIWEAAENNSGYAQFLLIKIYTSQVNKKIKGEIRTKENSDYTISKFNEIMRNVILKSQNGSLVATSIYSVILLKKLIEWKYDKSKIQMYTQTVLSLANKGISIAEVMAAMMSDNFYDGGYKYISDAENKFNPEAFYFHGFVLSEGKKGVKKNKVLGEEILDIAKQMGVKEFIK